MKKTLIAIIGINAALSLLFSPTQITLPGGLFTLSDLLLVIAFMVIIILFIIDEDNRLKMLPPTPLFIFIIAAFLSIVSIFSVFAGGSENVSLVNLIKEFIKEFSKYVLYLLIGVAVFKTAFSEKKYRYYCTVALAIGILLASLFAGYQRYNLNYIEHPEDRTIIENKTFDAFTTIETPVATGSTFGTWSDKGFHGGYIPYACFLALALPFLLYLAFKKNVWWILTAPILLLSGYSILAGRVVPIIIIGILITAWIFSKKAGVITTAAILVYLSLLAFIPSINRVQILEEPYRISLNIIEAEAYGYGKAHLKKFFAEQYASINILRGTEADINTALYGVGLSRYQEYIQQGYATMGEVTNQRLQLGEQGGYFLTLASMGILGLACLVFVYWYYFKGALLLKKKKNDISAPVIGAIIALILLTFVSSPIMRAEGILLAALFGLIESQKQSIGEKDL